MSFDLFRNMLFDSNYFPQHYGTIQCNENLLCFLWIRPCHPIRNFAFGINFWENSPPASHSAYVATLTELEGAKIDGFLYPNFMEIPKM